MDREYLYSISSDNNNYYPSECVNFRASCNTLRCQVIKKEGTENIHIQFPMTITITYPSECVNFRPSCKTLWCQVMKKKGTENIYILFTMIMTILNVWILDLRAIQSDVRLLKKRDREYLYSISSDNNNYLSFWKCEF